MMALFFLAKGDEQFRSFLPISKGPCFNLIVHRGGRKGSQLRRGANTPSVGASISTIFGDKLVIT